MREDQSNESKQAMLEFGRATVDELSRRKRTCRELAQYIWDRAHQQPICFIQDIARLIENERREAALRSSAPQADRAYQKIAGGDWYVRNGDGSEHRLLDIAPTLEREALKDPVHVASRSAPQADVRAALTVTDEMIDRAWAGIVGWDIADICHSASIIKADLRDGLEAALSSPPSVALETGNASDLLIEVRLCAVRATAIEECVRAAVNRLRAIRMPAVAVAETEAAIRALTRPPPGGAVAGNEGGEA